MAKTLVLILVCVTAVGLAGCSQQEIKTDTNNYNDQSRKAIQHKLNNAELRSYQEAITALNENKLKTARTLLEKLSIDRPELAEIQFNIALIHYKSNDLYAAASNLEQALKSNPNDPQALVLKAAIETKKGNINQAENLYQKALNHDENYANAHYNLALLYDIYYQDISSSAEHYQRYLELTDYKDKRTQVWLEELNSILKKKTQLKNNQAHSPAINNE